MMGMALRNSGSRQFLLEAGKIKLEDEEVMEKRGLPEGWGHDAKPTTVSTSPVPSVTQLLLGVLESLLKAKPGIGVGELKDEGLGAISFGGAELHLVWGEGHAEGQGLFLRQLPVDGSHQVLDHVIQALGTGTILQLSEMGHHQPCA